MPETDEHVVAVVALLRQLWLGLSAYRLYPGSVTRPGFVSAVERIGTVAARALADGPVDVEIRGDRFSMDGELLPSDDSGERLALACFERGVERVVVREVPTAEDLGDLYGILSTPPSELAAQGEAGLSLLAAGVTSITLSEVGPAPVEGADHAPEEMAERLVPDAAMLASQLMLEDLPGSPRDQAETLMNRLRALLARGVGEGIAPIDVHSAVHDALDDLPPELRRTVIDLAIEHLGDDPAAQRLIGTMSDTELTRALVDLGRGGHRDPEELARMLADSGARHVDLVDLTVALEAGWEEAGTIIAGLEQLGIDLSQQRAATLAAGSATEALSDYLSATEADDVRSMRAGMTAGASDRTNALLALRDYLTLESDLERVGEVLDVWAEELRDAIRERDQRRVASLLPPVRGALAGSDGESGPLFVQYARRALDRDLILDLATAEPEASATASVPELLEPLGDLGVEVLLDLLAEETDTEHRAKLLGILRRTVRGHVGPVASRLNDPRWYVVRNAVALLGSAGGMDVLSRLAVAARHEAPAVRREATTALVIAGGVAAAPYLLELAEQGPEDVRRLAVSALGALAGPEAAAVLAEAARSRRADRTIRELALEELARHPDGGEVLRDLGRRSGGLPWRLRRQARALLRAWREESR